MNGNQKFKLLFYANNQRAKNNLVPIYCRIYLNGRRAEFSTPHKVEVKHWNSKTQKMRAVAPNALLINTYQDNVRNALNQLFLKSVASEEMLAAKELKSRFLGKDEGAIKQKGLIEVIEYHNFKMQELVDADKVVKSTLKKYKTTLNKVKAFLRNEYQIKKIPLEELKYRFITDFEHYLLAKEKLISTPFTKALRSI